MTADDLKACRELMGLTKKKLASALSISRTTLLFMEEGKIPVPPVLAYRIREIFEEEGPTPNRPISPIEIERDDWTPSLSPDIPEERRREVKMAEADGNRYRAKTQEILGRGW